jgi:pimeloyl-ACP methyl ester carboxylesterase
MWYHEPRRIGLSRDERTPQEVKTREGRRLAIDVAGAPNGTPVFLIHGTPGSKGGPRPRNIVLYRLGVRLISYDRPGYGDSDRHEGRTVGDAAHDVEDIADALRIERFAVVGRSGGGPHALACAAILAERMTRAAVLVGVAPPDAPDLDWFSGMTEANVSEYTTADADPLALVDRLTRRAEHARIDPESMFRFLEPQLSPPDRRVVDDIAIRRLLSSTYVHALRDGAAGWIDDALAFRKDWNVDLSRVTAPVKLWHGADDTFSPVAHTYWLADRIQRADVEVASNAAHFGAVEILPRILAWLTVPVTADASASRT